MHIDLPQYQIKLLLKLEKACAGFVLNKYATCDGITKLKWLLVPGRIDFAIWQNFSFKGIFKENIPENLDIRIRNSNRSLRTPNKVNREYTNFKNNIHFTSIMETRYITNFRTK